MNLFNNRSKQIETRIIALIITLIIILVFYKIPSFGFTRYDDGIHIYANPNFSPSEIKNLLNFWRGSYKGLYIPVTYTVWFGIAKLTNIIFGTESTLNPFLFHSTNLLIHIGNSLLVFTILKELLRAGTKINNKSIEKNTPLNISAGIGALFFALHPLQLESIAWASEMKGLLCWFFSLLAIWQYLIFSSESANNNATGKRFTLATLLFVMALLSKPSAVIIPLILLAIEHYIFSNHSIGTLKRLSLWIIISAPIPFIAKLAQPNSIIKDILPIWIRPLLAYKAISFYLYKLIIPIKLSADYGLPADITTNPTYIRIGWLITIALIYIVWYSKNRFLRLSFIIFIIGMLPVSGLVPFYFQQISLVADRYIYFSILGASLALASLSYKYYTNNKVLLLVILTLCSLAAMSIQQADYWKDDLTLHSRIFSLNKNSYIGNMNLGAMYIEEGNIEKAYEYFSRGVKIKPNYYENHYQLALVLRRRNEIEKAICQLKKAVEINNDYFKAYVVLGEILANQGKFNEAIHTFREVLRINPKDHFIYFHIGNIYADTQRRKEAIFNLQKSIELNPNFAKAYISLGRIYTSMRRFEDALQQFNNGLRIEPKNHFIYLDIGNIYAHTGELEKAVTNLTKAVELNPDFANAQNNLGGVLASMGRFEEAIIHFKEALRINPNDNLAKKNIGLATKSLKGIQNK